MIRVTPDGARYLAMARGIEQPLPFQLRRGLPVLCRTSEFRWVLANVVSMMYAAVGIGILAAQHGAALWQSIVAVALFVGLPWVRFCWQAPVLVDMPALMCAVMAAVLWPVYPFAAIVVTIAGACISERTPLWASVFALSPVLLLALAIPLFNYFTARRVEVDPRDPLAFTLQHPLKTGLTWHRDQWLDPWKMLLPWGACLIAFANPSWWLAAALVVGYAQLLVATDTVRLYQQAAPVMCVSAALALPPSIPVVAIVAAVHLYLSNRSDGV